MKAFTNRLIASFGVFLLTLAFAGQTHATFPGKNGRIAFTGASGDVFTMNPDGTDVTQLTFFGSSGGSTCCVAWSPTAGSWFLAPNLDRPLFPSSGL